MSSVGLMGASWAVILLMLGGGIGLPLGVPPGPEDPLLAKIAPEECLYYTSWAGMAAPDPGSSNEVERLLAEPELRLMLDRIEQQLVAALEKGAAEEGEQAQLAAQLAPDLVKALLTRPAALFVSDFKMGEDGPDVNAALVVSLKEETAAVKASLEKLQSSLLGPAVESIELGKVPAYRIQPDPNAPALVWAVLGKYLVAGVGEESVAGVIQRARTETPAWLVNLKTNLPVERPASVSYVNVQKLIDTLGPLGGPPATKIVAAVGLGNVKSLSAVTGLEETGFVGRSLLEFDGQPAGLMQLLVQEPLAAEDLTPIPADSTLALAARMDASRALDVVLDVAGQIEPRARGEMEEALAKMNNELGIDLRADILASLGDVWCAYNSPGEGGLILTGLTATVTVNDRDRLARAHDRLTGMLKAALRGPDAPGRRRGPQLKQFEFAGQQIFVLSGIDDEFPFAPSWCLTEDHVIFALFPQNIKAMLSRGDDYRSLGTVPEVADLVSGDQRPGMLFYQDTRQLFELGYPLLQMLATVGASQLQREGIDLDISLLPSASAILPHLRPGVSLVRRTETGIGFETRQSLPGGNVGATIPVAAALLLPAVGSARKAARRTQSMNNLKQLALTMHMYHDSMGKFPAAYEADKDGKPMLSWRVRVLPYLEQQGLYDQFHFDEPWDSEHNKNLIERMPETFKSPSSPAGPGMTHYMTVRGKDTMFPGADAVRMAQIRDGTSNSIMIVEADKPVIWTKPDDYEYDPDNPGRGLTGPQQQGFNAAFGDGSVRFITRDLDPQMLLRLFMINDGEVVEWP